MRWGQLAESGVCSCRLGSYSACEPSIGWLHSPTSVHDPQVSQGIHRESLGAASQCGLGRSSKRAHGKRCYRSPHFICLGVSVRPTVCQKHARRSGMETKGHHPACQGSSLHGRPGHFRALREDGRCWRRKRLPEQEQVRVGGFSRDGGWRAEKPTWAPAGFWKDRRAGDGAMGSWEKGRGPGAAGAAAAESLGSCSGNLHLIPCVFGFSGVRNDPEACTLRMRTLF